ncbi:MAG: hypothetical protein WCV00_08190 [Verrucomicrobiia bacterium]|jgi:hypothetical protein
MSLAHIRFVREADDATTAEYRVECPDMGEKGQWQQVGRLRLDKFVGKYKFTPGLLWIEKRALPPSLYGLPEPEQKRLLSSDYDGFAWGTWAMIIHHYASSLLEHRNYPIRYPETMFSENEPRG